MPIYSSDSESSSCSDSEFSYDSDESEMICADICYETKKDKKKADIKRAKNSKLAEEFNKEMHGDPLAHENDSSSKVEVDDKMMKQFNRLFNYHKLPEQFNLLRTFTNAIGLSFDEFRARVCSKDYLDEDQLYLWSKKYVKIENNLSKRIQLDKNHFFQMLKSITFPDKHMLKRFIMLFIHECFVFFSTDISTKCYYRVYSAEYKCDILKEYPMANFKTIDIKYQTKANNGVKSKKSIKFGALINSIPNHIFENRDYIWNSKSYDLTTMSMALNFQFDEIKDEIKESDLPESLIHYFKDVICASSNEQYQWFLNWLANIIHQPNKKTGVMLVLYSQEFRLGKSTLTELVSMMMGELNICEAKSLESVFGDRGCVHGIGRKLVILEEMVKSNNDFVKIRDQMKSAITDKNLNVREYYKATGTTRNTHEYIACSNNLIAILPERMTVLKVAPIHQNDKKFYTQLRDECFNRPMINKLAAFLKPYQSHMPMYALHTETEEIMKDNSKARFEDFIDILKDKCFDYEVDDTSNSCSLELKQHQNGKITYNYLTCSELYAFYKTFCKYNNYRSKDAMAFKSSLVSGVRGCEMHQLTIDNKRPKVYTFDTEFFN